MKKMLSLFMSMLIVLSALTYAPFSVLADDSDFDYTVSLGKAIITGYNGDETDLVIPATIDNYIVGGIDDEAFRWNGDLTSIALPNTVTSIGEYAFEYCAGLSAIDFPERLSKIGAYAFSGCSGLTQLSVPAAVTEIGTGAFDSCSGLESITVSPTNGIYDSRDNSNAIIKTNTNTLLFGCKNTAIPDSVTSIEAYAFRGCTGLTELTIPSSVTSIGWYAFYGCTGLTSVAIPDSVTTIGNRVFYGCSSLQSISLPDTLTDIEVYAFYGCSALTAITIPDGVTNIGYNAFRGCSSLTSVTIPSGVTTLNNYVFKDCTSLTTVVMPDSVTTVSANAFHNCSSLSTVIYLGAAEDFYQITVESGNTALQTSVKRYYPASDYTYTIADTTATVTGYHGSEREIYIPVHLGGCSVTGIADNAFENNTRITKVTIPAYVTAIGSGILKGCTNVTAIEVSPDNPYFCSDGNAIIKPATNTLVAGCKTTVMSDGIVTIGEGAFSGCTGLTTITVPESLMAVSDAAFSGCTGLSTVYYSGSEEAFNSITVGDDNEPFLAAEKILNNGYTYTVTDGAATITGYKGTATDLILPETLGGYPVTALGDNAFAYNRKLTSVTIPAGITQIGSNAFGYCSALDTLAVSPDNTVYDSRDGCNAVIETATNTLIAGCQNTVIPSTVTAIGSYAFFGCSGLTEIAIPATVSEIGSCAFYACKGLTDIALPDGMTAVANATFYACTGLTSVTIPDSVTAIGNNAFYGCSAVTGISSLGSITEIGDYAFYGCESMTDVTFGDSLSRIGERAFSGCSGFTQLSIPAGVSEIGISAYANCSALTAIEVSADNAVYDSRGGCNAIIETATDTLIAGCQNTLIPDSVTHIGMNAFYGCTGLTELVIPDGVTRIGEAAFYGCTGMTKLVIPAGVTAISDLAFYHCEGLESVSFYNGVTAVGNRAFYGCNALEVVNYFGTKEQYDNIVVGMMNTPLQNATKHYFATVTHIPATPNERGYDEYTCSECECTYADNYTGYASDDSALTAIISQINSLEQADYLESSYNELQALAAACSAIHAGEFPQTAIDEAVTVLLNAVSALIPYLNLTVSVNNGLCNVATDEEQAETTSTQRLSDVRFGTAVTLTVTPESGYVFKGWYETNSHRIFSTELAYTFRLTSNTTVEALIIPDDAASIYFKNDSGYIKAMVTKTCAEWSEMTEADVLALMPEVPYRFAATSGHWTADAADYLHRLAQGEDVVFTAQYTDNGRPDESALPPVSADGVPNIRLTGSCDTDSNVYTFVMAAGIDENCSIVSMGIAFRYGKPSGFRPENMLVTINNKMLTSKFEATAESGYYIVNVKQYNRYHWAARGYVTYYDSYGTLRTVYTEQLNVV